tara:strand:+ start:404 stop:583 length:180 start_codon:yes stop_codon:yes gene_type:complete
MDQKYTITDILEAVEEINNSKTVKKIDERVFSVSKRTSKNDIPPNTLKLIEEAEKNNKN